MIFDGKILQDINLLSEARDLFGSFSGPVFVKATLSIKNGRATYCEYMSPNFNTVIVCIMTCNTDCCESSLASSSLTCERLNSHRTGTRVRHFLDLKVEPISLDVVLHERLIFRISRSRSLEQLPFSASSTRPKCLKTAVNYEICLAMLAICWWA